MWSIIVLVIVMIITIKYISDNEKIRGTKLLPYLLMICMTPIYVILDNAIFKKILPCAPINIENVQKTLSSNDLRAIVYTVIAILMIILGLIFSRKLSSKKDKIIYNVLVILLNVVFTFTLCEFMMCA